MYYSTNDWKFSDRIVMESVYESSWYTERIETIRIYITSILNLQYKPEIIILKLNLFFITINKNNNEKENESIETISDGIA